MTAVRSGLMFIDQHRADIRIRFERYIEQMTQRQSNIQRLLFPEVIQLTPSEAILMERIMPELMSVGFDMSALGGNSYAIAGVPAGLEGLNPVTLIQGIVSETAEQMNGTIKQIHEALALSLARQAAIPQGQVLTNEEMENIVNQLFMCTNVNYTPDGKSILAIMPQSDIEQLLR